MRPIVVVVYAVLKELPLFSNRKFFFNYTVKPHTFADVRQYTSRIIDIDNISSFTSLGTSEYVKVLQRKTVEIVL